MRIRSASSAASIAIGSTARRSSRARAVSTREPPNVSQATGLTQHKVGTIATVEREARAAAAAAPPFNPYGFRDDAPDELVNASNAVLALIDAGKLDEAEQAGHELLKRFPDAHDGYARLGLVHEVRGAHREAIDYYRKVIAFARKRPGIYNSEFIEGYKHLISHLEPTIAD